MSRVLVMFGTTDGHTGKVAQALGARLRANGQDTSVVNAAAAQPDPAPYDAILVAASVHAGGYQREIASWVRQYSQALNAKPTAFASVCLGVLEHKPDVDRELSQIINRFLESTAWRPSETRLVAGALKYTQYNFLKRWLMKRIARRAGGDTDTSRDYEYTDWTDLDRFVDRFCARFAARPESRTA